MLSRRWPVIACLFCATLGAIAGIETFYPGYMSVDSVSQLQQGRSGVYDDLHPPVMAWIWGALDRRWPGPLSMVVVQNLLFWGGLAGYALWRSRKWAWAIVPFVGLLPPVFSLLGTVWKDVQMGAALMAAAGLIVWARRAARAPLRFSLAGGALLFLWYAAAVRHNGILPVLPLLLLLVDGFVPLRGAPARGLGLALALLFVIAGLTSMSNAHLATRHFHTWQQSMEYDLVGISIAQERDLFPASFWEGREAITVKRMAEIYDPGVAWRLYVTSTPGPHFDWVGGPETTAPTLRDLPAAWATAVLHHPLEFLEHRARLSARLLRFTIDDMCGPFYDGITPNNLGVVLTDSALNRWVMSKLNALKHTWIFDGWPFLALLFLVCAVAILRRAPVAFALSTSGLLNGLPHLLIGVACDFRFLWWSVICALLTLIDWPTREPGRDGTQLAPAGRSDSANPAQGGDRPQTGLTRAAEMVPELSIVVPLYNEAENVRMLYDELASELKKLGKSHEILFVDDGSTDGTSKILDELAKTDPKLVVVRFRRNYGQTAALSAGIERARGEIILPMDGDLQNDPADIGKLVAKIGEGFECVSGWRRDRQDKAVTRRFPSQVANWLISKVSGIALHDYGCTLKAYRRDVIEGVRLYGEMHRFIPVYAAWQGARVTELVVNHRARRFGQSKYGLNRIFKVMLDLLLVRFLFQYLAKPIYVFGGFGLAAIGASFLAGAAAVALKLLHLRDFVSTPLPLLAALLFLTGFLSVLMGLLAELVIRTYYESQDKRPYLVAEVINAPETPEPVRRISARSE